MGASTVWRILKMAATRIPWGRVVENAPVVADLVGRAKERLRGVPQDDLVERLTLVHEEYQKLEKVLLQTANRLQEMEGRLQLVAARQRVMIVVTAVSLLLAVSALAVVLSR